MTSIARCLAGVALGDIHLRFAWQARCLALWVAGVALGDIPFRFVWQAWHLWGWAGVWAGSGGALGAPSSRVTLRHFCMAGVALGDVHSGGALGAGLGLVARLVPVGCL